MEFFSEHMWKFYGDDIIIVMSPVYRTQSVLFSHQ